VFLGGSCGDTTWRVDIAIKRLQDTDIAYFNPQVAVWDESCIKKENDAKAACTILLFVIDNSTRAVMSIAEACLYMGEGRNVVLVVQDIVRDGDDVADLNRGRKFVKEIADAKKVPVFANVDHAMDYIVGV
jgi:hypothetical protein